jgi:Rieske Fe-S protein
MEMKAQRLFPADKETVGAETPGAPSERISGAALNRRKFCNRLLLTSSGLLVGALVLSEKAAGQPAMQVAYPPRKIEGAESLLPGSSLYFNYPARTDAAILVRGLEGEYYAYSCRCSHMGCSVYFERAARRLECPCHKGAYDLQTGFVMYGPPVRGLSQIVLHKRAGGEVWATGRNVYSDDHNG